MKNLLVVKKQFLKDYSLKEFQSAGIFIQKSIPFTEDSMKYLKGTPFLNFVILETPS